MGYTVVSPQPTLAGFTSWIYSTMGVPAAWLPNTSDTIFYAFNTAYATVNTNFQCVPGPFFFQMVYNLAGHFLASWAQDPDPWPVATGYKNIDGQPLGYFQWLRQVNNINGFITGIVNASSDEGTSVGLVVPKQAENLTLSQLQLTTTPWGRFYLGQAEAYGTNWGMS